MAPDNSADLAATIYQAAYMVRHYSRGSRMARESLIAQHRSDAIRSLGLAVRHAFNSSEDFEPLLLAVFDGLQTKDATPF